MKLLPPVHLSAQQRDWIIAARSGAVRTALRLASRNRVGLTRDDLQALAEDGLLAAAGVFKPAPGASFDGFAFGYVRGKVLHALRARRRVLKHEASADTGTGFPRAEARALLDDLGEALDPDAYDAYEDTDDDFQRHAQDAADDGALVLVLGRAARGAEKSLMRKELLERLDAAVAALEPADARLVQLRFREGKTLEEIAAVTRIPLSTVHAQLRRIVAGMRRRMEV